MIIDIKQFASLQKASKNSFFQQRQLVKQVMAGKEVFCNTCKQPLLLTTPDQDKTSGIRCCMGCTDIQLDFS